MELQVQQKELERQNEELKKTLEDLQESRELVSKIYDAGPVSYVSINEDGVIHHANRAFADLLNLSLASVINNKLTDFIHPDDRDEFYLFMKDHELQFSNAVLSIRLNRSKEHSKCFAMSGVRNYKLCEIILYPERLDDSCGVQTRCQLSNWR
jgi:PAS domain-containing protein